MGGAVAITAADEPSVERVLGLAPCIPERLPLEPLQGPASRCSPRLAGPPAAGCPGCLPLPSRGAASSGRVHSASRETYERSSGALHGIAVVTLVGRPVPLPRAHAWAHHVAAQLVRPSEARRRSELACVGDLDVPDEPEPLEDADHPPRQVDLKPVEAVPRGGGERVVVVVPALAEDEERDQPVVAGLVAGAVVLTPEHVADRVHAEGRVLVGEDADEAAPDEPFDARPRRAADRVADREREPERQRDPEQVGPVDQAHEPVVVEILAVRASLLHAEVREEPADMRVDEAADGAEHAVAVADMG